MSLALDARRLAMLEAMGITLWVPEAVRPTASVPAVEAPAPRAPRAAVAAPADHRPALQALAQPPQHGVRPLAERAAAPVAAPNRVAASPAATALETTTEVWQLAPAVHLYPHASGPAEGGPWLILLESTHPATPLVGAVGDLLDKMLRALGLHQHPQVWLAVLQRPGGLPMAAEMAGSLAPVDWQPLPARLAHTLRTVQPARVLLLGQKVAQTVLARSEPVGQLRQQRFDLAGHAAAVSYDPSFLLRTSQPKKYKAQTWADLQFAAQLPAKAE